MSILSDQLALAEVIGGGIGAGLAGWQTRKVERERFRLFKEFMEANGVPITGKYETADEWVIDQDMQGPQRNAMLGMVAGETRVQRVGQTKKAMEMARALVSDVPSEMQKHGIDPNAPSVQSFRHDFRQRRKEFEEANQTQGPSRPEGKSTLRQLTNAWAKRGSEAFVLQNNMTPKKLQAALANYEAGSGLFDKLPLNLKEVQMASRQAMGKYKKQDEELSRRDILKLHNAEANRFMTTWAGMQHAGYEPEYIEAALERQKSRLDILADQFDMLGDLEEKSPTSAPLTVRDPDSPTGYAKASLVDGQPVKIPGTVAPDPAGGGTNVTVNMPGALEKSTTSDIQKSLASDYEITNQLDNAVNEFDPEYLTVLGKGKNWVNSWREKLQTGNRNFDEFMGTNLSQEDKAALKGYTGFVQNVERLFNAYRKEITGAAASYQELERLYKSFINTDMSPSQFEAAVKAFKKELITGIAIKQSILQEGNVLFGSDEYAQEFDYRYQSGRVNVKVTDDDEYFVNMGGRWYKFE